MQKITMELFVTVLFFGQRCIIYFYLFHIDNECFHALVYAIFIYCYLSKYEGFIQLNNDCIECFYTTVHNFLFLFVMAICFACSMVPIKAGTY